MRDICAGDRSSPGSGVWSAFVPSHTLDQSARATPRAPLSRIYNVIYNEQDQGPTPLNPVTGPESDQPSLTTYCRLHYSSAPRCDVPSRKPSTPITHPPTLPIFGATSSPYISSGHAHLALRFHNCIISRLIVTCNKMRNLNKL